ncbi:hypothetical protein [Glycomyces buryatensis]|uniref:Uncharacterized protein n=1 Tax=Glycomyces buryatensis TaxID=2570927 RepID=A0A4S8QDF9_9ACTN|nr:hypothetical protein [Glycomyces buryatensis]THV42408.1 hypothetical protein FAB82_07075 [Glycomyces buryatensis]
MVTLHDPPPPPPYKPPKPQGKADREVHIVTSIVFISVIFSLVVLTGPASSDPPLTNDEASEIVGEFFDALQAKDIDAALALTDLDLTDQHLEFLRPEIIADDWQVTTIAAAGTESSSGADVTVILEFDGESDSGVMEVGKTDDVPHIKMPLNETRVESERAFDWITVNGEAVEPTEFDSIFLLPGVYDFGSEAAGRHAVFPDTELSAGETVNLPDPSEYTDAAQRLVEADLDRCAEWAFPVPRGCPAGLEYFEDDLPNLHDVTDLDWEIVEYPQVSTDDGVYFFTVNTVEAGSVEVSGSAFYRADSGETGERQAFHLRCEINTGYFDMAIDADGEGYFPGLAPGYDSECEFIQ